MKSLSLVWVFAVLAIACGSEPETGENGYNSLVKLSSLPQGDEICTFGGTRIDTGLDENRNGELDLPEIADSQYLCLPDVHAEPGQDGQDGVPTLFISSPEAPGEHCPHGGIALMWGPDRNGDGELTVSEVTGTDYVCNGDPGRDARVSVRQVDSGTGCPAGGVEISMGTDADGNGVLDPSEVTSKAYVCNGSDGRASLVDVQEEPAGANCAHGGVRIASGVDADGNGVLDPSEVFSTQYVCNP